MQIQQIIFEFDSMCDPYETYIDLNYAQSSDRQRCNYYYTDGDLLKICNSVQNLYNSDYTNGRYIGKYFYKFYLKDDE